MFRQDDGGTDGVSTQTAGDLAPQINDQGTPVPVAQVEPMVDIVIAVQDLPRGLKIPEDGVSLQPWPERALPEEGSYFTNTSDVVGMIARTDLTRGAPVLRRQLVEDLRDIAATGSDAAAILEPGTRAVSVPLDLSGIGSVAYGIQDGDYVDVILSFLFIDVDEEFQTRLPNNISIITSLETGELVIGSPRQGRQEPSPLSPQGVLISPSEQNQRPRLVTQMTIENAFVVHVGYFPADGQFIGSTPTALPVAAAPEAAGEEQANATPQPTATSYTPSIVTLAVSPQDSLVLTWAVDSQIPITLALRPAGDLSTSQTQSVTLQYMIQNFNITQPDRLPFALEPPITSVRRFDLGTVFSFLADSASADTAAAQ
ncbi:MAG TPA: Flp pilus assembly protein CpaB [Aggregatilinea sp.]|jgi:pilus assembly protein CpaB|uniref:Flp pilus assembly protein CpaB n=1 Tax=Aggregatilinea sp. TaxID=2806333 RepID=UPI002C6FD65F|nr:Flp pilus assembly protein CpaB [Aggregatilinea sp.]HML20047.1 Flp pilus assembly protein CpaB [Aggregatilinea sp.]